MYQRCPSLQTHHSNGYAEAIPVWSTSIGCVRDPPYTLIHLNMWSVEFLSHVFIGEHNGTVVSCTWGNLWLCTELCPARVFSGNQLRLKSTCTGRFQPSVRAGKWVSRGRSRRVGAARSASQREPATVPRSAASLTVWQHAICRARAVQRPGVFESHGCRSRQRCRQLPSESMHRSKDFTRNI